MNGTATALSLADLEAFDTFAPDRGGRERRFCCPVPGLCEGKPKDAAHRSFSVNIETGLWKCARCDMSGKLKDNWKERPRENTRGRSRATPRYRPAVVIPADPASAPSEEFRKQIAGLVPLAGTSGEQYLAGRGVPLETARAARVMYSPRFYGRPAVVFPAYDLDGRLVAAEGRFVDGRDNPKVMTAGEKLQGVFATPGAWEAERLILVEAPICALTLAAAGFPAVALLGASNCPAWLLERCALRPVVLALDGDPAGDKGAQSLAASLAGLGAKVERLRPNWFVDWNALGPRLEGGLQAALAEVFAGNSSSVWDEPAAWSKVQAALRALPELVPEGGIGWAEANNPALLRTCDEAEAAINDAYATEDRAALDRALMQFTDAYRVLGMAFREMSTRVDIPDQAELEEAELLALFSEG